VKLAITPQKIKQHDYNESQFIPAAVWTLQVSYIQFAVAVFLVLGFVHKKNAHQS
jgi:hypothetical protein